MAAGGQAAGQPQGGSPAREALWQRALDLAQPAATPDPADLAEILPPPAEVLRQVVPAVRKALSDPDPAVRGEAILTLGALGLREDLAALRALLKDPDAGIRHRAILALGMLQDPSALAALAHLLESEAVPRERAMALLALGLLPDGAGHARISEYLGTLRGRHFERSRDEFLAGVLGIALLPDSTGRGVLETLLDDASLRDAAVRGATLAALAAVAPGAPHLARSLTDRTAEVRLAAALALAMAGEHGAADGAGRPTSELLRQQLRDSDPLVRAGALLALGCRKDPSVLGPARQLALGADEGLRPFALLHLGLAGGEPERRELHALLTQPMAQGAEAAMVRALGTLGDLGASARFRELLADATATTQLRACAAAALADLHDTRSLAVLREQFFRSEDPDLLAAFAVAARRIAPREGIARDPEHVDVGLARPAAAWARYLAQVRALASAGSRGMTGVLLKLLGDPEAPARGRAAALAGLRDYLGLARRHPGALLARLPARPLNDPLLREIESWFQPKP